MPSSVLAATPEGRAYLRRYTMYLRGEIRDKPRLQTPADYAKAGSGFVEPNPFVSPAEDSKAHGYGPGSRPAITDALGRPIPLEGELHVWLDDDLEDRQADPEFIHLISAREVCFLLLTGRVVELSLDHDLSDDTRFGKGIEVIDFLDEQHGVAGRDLWPRGGITLHTANPGGREAMARAIESIERRHGLVVKKSFTAGNKPRFEIQ
jgi:hypothetical protein